MHKRTCIFTLALTLGLTVLGTAACSKTDDARTESPATKKASPVETVSPTAAKTEIASKTPEDWLVVEDTTFIPVIDELSRTMRTARQAFLNKDNKTAAADVRAGATFLSKESSIVSEEGGERIQEAVKGLEKLAGDLDSGKVTSVRRLDKVFINAHLADIEHRWLVVDETDWYPYVEEPDQHFRSAKEAFLKKEYQKAAEEIRKGTAFVKLEAGRASADAKQALNASAHELERLADDIAKNGVKDVEALENTFARADQALAQSHRVKAAESWAKKEPAKTGYELKAAARYLEQGAAWVGTETQAGASEAVSAARTVAGKLIEGAGYSAEGVGKGMDALGKAVSQFGQKVLPAKSNRPGMK